MCGHVGKNADIEVNFASHPQFSLCEWFPMLHSEVIYSQLPKDPQYRGKDLDILDSYSSHKKNTIRKASNWFQIHAAG